MEMTIEREVPEMGKGDRFREFAAKVGGLPTSIMATGEVLKFRDRR